MQEGVMATGLPDRAVIGEFHRLGLVLDPSAVHTLREWILQKVASDLKNDQAVAAALAPLVQQVRETAARRGTRTLSRSLLAEAIAACQGYNQSRDTGVAPDQATNGTRVMMVDRWQVVVPFQLTSAALIDLPPVSERRRALLCRYKFLRDEAERFLKMAALTADRARVFPRWPTQIVTVGAVRTNASRNGNQQAILGLLVAHSVDEWFLEDPTGSIALRICPNESETSECLHPCTAPRTLLSAGSFLVALGVYEPTEDCFLVRELQPPPICTRWHAELLPLEKEELSSSERNAQREERDAPNCNTAPHSPGSPDKSADLDSARALFTDGNQHSQPAMPSENGRNGSDEAIEPDLENPITPAGCGTSLASPLPAGGPDDEVHIVIAGDLALNDVTTYPRWRRLLRELYASPQLTAEQEIDGMVSGEERGKNHPSLETVPPKCIFVLCGPFLRSRDSSWPPSSEEISQNAIGTSRDEYSGCLTPFEASLVQAFQRFGKLLATFRTPLRESNSEFVLVPAERDLECFGDVLPRPPLASVCVDVLRAQSNLRAAQIRAAMDPARLELRFGNRTLHRVLVHATETLCGQLAADALPWPPNCRRCQSAQRMEAFAGDVFRTILHQRHISPLPGHKHPIFWPLDRECLWTLTKQEDFDDVIVVADNALPLHLQRFAVGGSASLSGGIASSTTLCVAPGSFARGGSLVWIQVSSNQEKPPVARPLHLLSEGRTEAFER